jgi:glycosyltransferase involved in cell wall biosynthesis
MRILFLSSWFPYPPDNGSRIRIFNLVRELGRRHEVTLLSFTNHERDRDHVAEMARYCAAVQIVAGREFHPGSWRSLAGFLSPSPRWLVDVHSPEMAALVAATLAQKPFDVVVGSQIKMLPYLRDIEGVPTVLEELETEILLDDIRRAGSPAAALRTRLRWLKLARYLRDALRHDLAGCTVVSEPERDNLLRLMPGYAHWAVIPNGVDLAHYAGEYPPAVEERLVFSGALTYTANYDAMAYFLSQVWPQVRARRPDVRLAITGRHDGVDLAGLALDDHVRLTGYLPDVRPMVAGSRLCVVPLRQGGGTRLKILEAMALGTPVVTTRKGAEGLAARDGEHLLLADTPEELTAAILRLLSEPETARRLAAAARQLVEERYGWAAIGGELAAFVERTVAERGA